MRIIIVFLMLLQVGIVFAQQHEHCSLVVLGDIYSGESYSTKPHRYHVSDENLVQSFSGLAPYLKGADHRIGNLECALPGAEATPISTKKTYIHWADNRLLNLLKTHGISTLSLANNHSIDYGRKGLQRTRTTLKASDFNVVGVGKDSVSAAKPVLLPYTRGTQKMVAVLSAGFGSPSPYDVAATSSKPGINLWTTPQALKQMRALRSKHPKSIIIAYPHWGGNYEWRTKTQQQLAHALIDGGADIVIGHGAHMIQEIEYYKNHLIVYSLGNFFFMTPGRYDKRKALPMSAVARVHLSSAKPELSLYPIYTNNLQADYQPRPASKKEVNDLQDILSTRCPRAMKRAHFKKDTLGYFISLPILSRTK